MKLTKFNFDKFKASVDSGNPLRLFDSFDEPKPVKFLVIAETTRGTEIVCIHNGMIDSWKASGQYGFANKEPSMLDLQMEDRPEVEVNELDEFAKWVFNTTDMFIEDDVNKFRSERSGT